MLLDRIEIDNHGPLNRVELGPLSHHLNVVLGPAGSGKTAISRFIRDSLIDREYPRGMLSSSSGRIVWVDANGWIHCRREQDGTPGGRRTVDFEARSDNAHDFTPYKDGWFDPTAAATETASSYRHSLANRTLQAIRIPESIVDGVMIDTTVSNVSRVVASCMSAGLDREDLARLPFENETARFTDGEMGAGTRQDDRRRRELRAELADVEAELAKYQSAAHAAPVASARTFDVTDLSAERDAALQRREGLIARRSSIRHSAPVAYPTNTSASSSLRNPSSRTMPVCERFTNAPKLSEHELRRFNDGSPNSNPSPIRLKVELAI